MNEATTVNVDTTTSKPVDTNNVQWTHTPNYYQVYPGIGVCPGCGRCRTCGRGWGFYPYYPTYPYQPYYTSGGGSWIIG